ncbi:hypothetical protein PENANT_c083G09793 [Penicillium antarcticum]|uniref:Uncharacterized protein n=1 Tax=Penicillium antarcticum TaxID=416450 RepID=A0A1V6PQ02_9EURO|nr:hypothetical protein PENANT_c083G09793 [Penicillium antarcticum]
MDTGDQFAFGQMSYPYLYTSPQCLSSYHSAVGNRSFGAGFQSRDFIYGLHVPVPSPCWATPALSPSPPPLRPKYCVIQPRPKNDGSKARKVDKVVRTKSSKRQKGEMRRSSQRPKRSSELKPTQLKADTSLVSPTKPGRESTEPCNQYTESDLCSSNQVPTFTPGPIPPANGSASVARIESSVLTGDASGALVRGRPTDHQGLHQHITQPNNQQRWPSLSFRISQSHSHMEASYTGLAAHLEKSQVLQSLSIVKDYMAKHPLVFEEQAPETVQRWLVGIETMDVPRSLSEGM